MLIEYFDSSPNELEKRMRGFMDSRYYLYFFVFEAFSLDPLSP